jgi:hypothetical protein
MKRYLIGILLLPLLGLGQTNIVRNGSFEGDFINTFPLRHQDMFQNPPPEWEEYVITNSDDDEKWLTDSIAVPPLNMPFNPFNNGYYSVSVCDWPFDSNAVNVLMPASTGHFYVGFNNSNDGGREGIQQDLGCILNSGGYTLQFDWARPFNCNDSEFKVHLSDIRDARRKLVTTLHSNGSTTIPGQWYTRNENFTLDLNDNQDMDNDWLVFTGNNLTFENNLSKYMYLDNVRLFRYCDYLNRCTATTGQICPTVVAHLPPLDPLTINGMDNVRHLRLKIYNSAAGLISDDTYTNPNGMPNFHLARLDLPIFSASSTYHYDAEFTNNCGAVRRSGSFTVLDTALYNLSPAWMDSTANWSETPVPCCLHTLTLQNMQIVGDVFYIVRDQITVQGGVSVAPGSNVILQAGNVVELDSVEFDGTNSTVEILEVPCPNRMAADAESGCGAGGSVMVINAGNIVQPNGNVHPVPSDPSVMPFIGTSAGVQPSISLWVSPNPLHDQTELGFTLDVETNCSLRILDLQMRTVKVVIKGELLDQGAHVFTAILNDIPAGTYLAELRAGDMLLHERLIKL